jgi:hypothetical protein
MRWTEDTRGRGVASGEALLPAVDALRGAMTAATWVAEKPEAHLLPHIRRAVERDASPWTLVGAEVVDAVLVVSLRWTGPGNRASLRAEAMALAGSFAESNTFVRESRDGEETAFEVVTGMLDGDGPFSGHGHLVRLRVVP